MSRLKPLRTGAIRVRGTHPDGRPAREYVVEFRVLRRAWDGSPWETKFVAYDPKHPHLLRPVTMPDPYSGVKDDGPAYQILIGQQRAKNWWRPILFVGAAGQRIYEAFFKEEA